MLIRLHVERAIDATPETVFATLHEWRAMVGDAARAGGLRRSLRQLRCPPERALSRTQEP